MVKKRVEDGELVNGTGSELEILQNIEKAFYRNNKGSRQRNTQRSLKWFSQYIPRSYNRVRMAQMMRDRDMWSDTIRPGDMYLAVYDPIHKDTLPYYDEFPLLMPWDMWKGENELTYIISINLHFLPPALRFAAMKVLLTKRNEKRYRQSTKLKISWSVLKSMSNSKLFEHCVRVYRMDHFRSKFIKIPPQSWELVVFLPLARIKGDKTKAMKV